MNDLKAVEYYLNRYALTDARIESLIYRINRLKEQVYSIASTKPYTTGDGAKAVTRQLQDAHDELVKNVNEQLATQARIGELIESLEDPEMLAVFECRYFEQKTFSQIAKKLFMSKTKVQSLHKAGLGVIAEQLK